MTMHTLEHRTQRLLDWYETHSWTAELESPAPVADLLRRSPVEWDADGRLLGFGLTLRHGNVSRSGSTSVRKASQRQAAHPEAIVVSVAAAFTLTNRLPASWIQAAQHNEEAA